MISVRINATSLLKNLAGMLTAIQDKERMMRTVATGVRAEMKHRIHTLGYDANGDPIGDYSPAYMKIRTKGRKIYLESIERYQFRIKQNDTEKQLKLRSDRLQSFRDRQELNRLRVQDGLKSRKIKRPFNTIRYNRTSNTTVVASLTRQMENDFSVLPTDAGYGLGYNNPENRLKAGYVENTYKKKIFGLTTDEKQLAVDIAIDYLDNATPE